ncbi:MAG: hypothetical protein ACOY3P_14320 [Planctomycetota bacterium]
MANELVAINTKEYPALDPKDSRLSMMLENLGGEGLGVGDFNRVKVPTGGGTSWTLETVDGDVSLKHLDGIILYSTRRRAFWKDQNPTASPPDCASADMMQGAGTPGGMCEVCPMNQYGSAHNGVGKACKEVRLLFLLRSGQVLPNLISVPPGSLKNAKKYLLGLATAGIPYHGAVTRLSLDKASNAQGVSYAKINFAKVSTLDAESHKAILALVRRMESTFKAAAVTANDVADGGTEEV